MDFTNDVEQCLKVLEKGGLILYPTDTIWGIGCDATNETAVTRVFQLKKREESKVCDQQHRLSPVHGLAEIKNNGDA